eukprot:m.84604 g.84604  ORF g.84604 m.84604 type:complete len:317 (-) comp14811_c0_seq1:25-975(-)
MANAGASDLVEAARAAARDRGFPDKTFLVTSPEGTTCVIVGTAHVSKHSVTDVQNTIATCSPTAVLIELCDERKGMISLPLDRRIPALPMNYENIMAVMRRGEGLSGVLHLSLSAMTDDVMNKLKLEMPPGCEFAAAAQAAQARGIPVVLGDRSLAVTLKRAWRSLSWLDRIRFLYQIIVEMNEEWTEEQIEQLKQMDLLQEMLKELAEQFPRLSEPIVSERDRYLRHTLRQTCMYASRRQPEQPLVVGVVGLGHVPGIIQTFSTPLDYDDFNRIRVVPPPARSPLRSLLQYTLIAAGTATIATGIWRRCQQANWL